MEKIYAQHIASSGGTVTIVVLEILQLFCSLYRDWPNEVKLSEALNVYKCIKRYFNLYIHVQQLPAG